MEVKDINSIAAMLVSNRSQKTEGQNGGQTALQNFRELFTQGSLFDFQTVEKTSTTSNTSALNIVKKADIADKADKKATKSSVVSDKKDSVSIKENKTDKAESKPAAKETSNSATTEQKKETVQDKDTEKTDTAPAQTEDKTDTAKADNSQPADEGNQPQAENSEDVAEIPAPTEPTTQIQETMDDDSATAIMPDVLNILLPDTLQTMGAVTVYNSMDNTYSVMTGEEISDLLASSSIDMSAYLSTDGHSDVTLMQTVQPAEPQNQAPQIALDGFEQIMPEVAENVLPTEKTSETSKPHPTTQTAETFVQTQDITENLVDENIVKQSDKLAEMISSDKKLKVDVKVEEENFSYQTAKVSVKEVLASADTKQFSGEGKGLLNANAEDAQPQPIQAQNNTVTANVLNGTVSPQAMPAQDMAATTKINVQNTQTTAIKAMGEVSSTNMSQLAGVDGAAQGLKSENGVAAENKTSFRDIYKGMSREVAEQVKVNITKSAVKGVDSIEIKLKPEELGHIEIKMQLSKDGKLQAHIIASRAETGEMLQKELPTLEKAFSDAGFNLDEGSLSFSYREENSAQEQNNELRNFIGRVLEQDAENENTPEYGSHISEVWDGTSALNIRV